MADENVFNSALIKSLSINCKNNVRTINNKVQLPTNASDYVRYSSQNRFTNAKKLLS